MKTCHRKGCDTPVHQARHKYCGRACSTLDRPRQKTLGPKQCCICGNDFYSTGHESPSTFAMRVACGPLCGARQAARTKIQQYEALPPKVMPTEIQRVELLYAVYREQGVSYAG